MGNASQRDILTDNANASLLDSKRPLHVLVVDDDRVMRMMMEERVCELGYKVTTADNGKNAYDILLKKEEVIDVVLLDQEMPEMNGTEVVKRMKANPQLRHIPIVMVAGSEQLSEIKKAIESGIFYYLLKPFDQKTLISVFLSAAREIKMQNLLKEELVKHQPSFDLMDMAVFSVKTIEDAEAISAFLATCYPKPTAVLQGLAKLIVNGIEYGNLGITYDEKTDLINRSMWRHEVDYRCGLPQNEEKAVRVTFRRNKSGLFVKIEDEGHGFDWKRYLEIDPARLRDNHGRGIAQACSVSFDEVRYNTAGNVVTAIVKHNK